MRCNKSQEYVSQQLDGVLPPDMASKLRDHLDGCAECEVYRSDMLMGQRLLAATKPKLPENFEWKLQLKLKQTLHQAAGEAQYPWTEKVADRWSWLRNFGAATAVGLAAVLALAMVVGPSDTGSKTDIPFSRFANDGATVANIESTSDRRPLFKPSNEGLYRTGSTALVSATGDRGVTNASSGAANHWSGANTNDLRLISNLRSENVQLRIQLRQLEYAASILRAQLDTDSAEALDLQQEK